jgi:hypothetical protein
MFQPSLAQFYFSLSTGSAIRRGCLFWKILARKIEQKIAVDLIRKKNSWKLAFFPGFEIGKHVLILIDR